MAEPSGPESGPDRADDRGEEEAVAPRANQGGWFGNERSISPSYMGGVYNSIQRQMNERTQDYVARGLELLGNLSSVVTGPVGPALGSMAGLGVRSIGLSDDEINLMAGKFALNSMFPGATKMAQATEWLGDKVAGWRGMSPEERLTEAKAARAREAATEAQVATRGGGGSTEAAGTSGGAALTPQALRAQSGAPPDPLLMPRLPGEWLTPTAPLVPSRVLPMNTDLPGEQPLVRGADPRFDPRAHQALPPEALAYLKALSRVLK